MNLTDSDILKFQKGTPIFFGDICAVYSRTLGDIVDEGYDNFQDYLSIITMRKPQGKEIKNAELRRMLKNVTGFQYLLLLANIDYDFNQKITNAFRFFCKETFVTFSLDPAQIVLGPIEEKHLLIEENFYEFQDLIRKMYFLEEIDEQNTIDQNDNARVRALKEQFQKGRETRKRIKSSKSDGQENIKFSDLIGSITINNCGLNMDNIWNITYYAFHDQLRRMGWRDQFNINHSAALAGAKIKDDQLKYWIRSIINSD